MTNFKAKMILKNPKTFMVGFDDLKPALMFHRQMAINSGIAIKAGLASFISTRADSELLARETILIQARKAI
tara:strand:- start:354 stop:569 length:216 start_codon:yes stop_codon:yes gene_type:complete